MRMLAILCWIFAFGLTLYSMETKVYVNAICYAYMAGMALIWMVVLK